jgi:hypothetical protein
LFVQILFIITTSCKLRGPFLTFLGEGQVFRLLTGRTANDQQAPQLKSPETVADVTLIALEGSHQLLMTARYQSTGPLVIGRPTSAGYVSGVVTDVLPPSQPLIHCWGW